MFKSNCWDFNPVNYTSFRWWLYYFPLLTSCSFICYYKKLNFKYKANISYLWNIYRHCELSYFPFDTTFPVGASTSIHTCQSFLASETFWSDRSLVLSILTYFPLISLKVKQLVSFNTIFITPRSYFDSYFFYFI